MCIMVDLLYLHLQIVESMKKNDKTSELCISLMYFNVIVI